MKKILSICVLLSSVFVLAPGVSVKALAATANNPPDASQPVKARDLQVTINVLQPPSLMFAENKQFLVYEVFLTNFKNRSIELINVDVGDKNKDSKITNTFNEATLNGMMAPIGVNFSSDDATIILPGMQKILYMWVAFDEDADVPNTLQQTFTFQPLNEDSKPIALAPIPMPINTEEMVVVAAPLRGDYWVSANGPDNASEHRRAYQIGDGKAYFPQRYAIDFVKIGTDGLTYKDSKSKNPNYYSYDANIYSVASGNVISVRNDIPENTPNTGITAVAIDKDTTFGNYIFVDIGNNLYALYAHLIPGSIQVKAGDRVEKGQVLGKLGNSGNSAEPHLHFQITDASDIIYSNGIPYGFEEFSLRQAQAIDSFGYTGETIRRSAD